MLRRSSWIGVTSLLAVIGCREAPEHGPAKPTLLPVAAAASASAPLTQPVAEAARVPLAQQLAQEAAARPAGALRSEALIDALAQRGVSIGAPRQVLARPIGALYCEAAVSQRGLALSLCAYPDAQAVLSGRARSHELFDRIVPGRTLIARGNTLLTLAPSKSAAREATLAGTLFAELTP